MDPNDPARAQGDSNTCERPPKTWVELWTAAGVGAGLVLLISAMQTIPGLVLDGQTAALGAAEEQTDITDAGTTYEYPPLEETDAPSTEPDELPTDAVVQ